jgi:putative flippase GtrA
MTTSVDAGAPLFERYRYYAQFVTDLFKYAFASLAALGADYAVLTLCHKLLGMNYLAAAAIGFACGLSVIYVLSICYVFDDRRRFGAGPELIGFLMTGVIGLTLNEALMGLFVGHLGLTVAFAKVPTAGLVFSFNFLTRRALLFSARENGAKDR